MIEREQPEEHNAAMKTFKNILAAVDLSQTLRSGSAVFHPPVEQAINEAIWIAKHLQAQLTIFAAIDVPAQGVYFSSEELDEFSGKLRDAGEKVLAELAARAATQGVAAATRIAAGTGWIEIIREVLRQDHDLVVAGARGVGGVQRFLFGSTSMKLLHNCPCPVWITRPEHREHPQNILVASDLSSVTEEALDLAAGIASATGAKLQVLHAVDCPLDRLWSTALSDFNTQAYHHKMIAEARHSLASLVERVLGKDHGLDLHLNVTERVVVADTAILHFINDHQIDLLVMGTMARGGIPGVFIGNTAERLATSVHCSLLAVKPADFQSPIHLPPPGGERPQPVI